MQSNQDPTPIEKFQEIQRFRGDSLDVESSSVNTYNQSFQDPVEWPDILSNNVRIFTVEQGSTKIKSQQFPKDLSNRSFSVKISQRVLKNGEIMSRRSLVYS